MANSPQTGTQAKESKINFKSQLKCCEFLRIHGQLAKLGLQMNSSQQQFLNKGKRPQLKIQTQKRIRYLLHYFGQNSNSPPPGTQRAFGVSQSSKRGDFDQRMLFNGSHGFLRFFTRFSTQKTFLSQRDHSHTVRVANAQLKKNAGPISQNSSFMLFKAVK